MNKIIKLFLLLCLIGNASLTATAEDTTDTALLQLNAAKQNVEDIENKIAVYGGKITAWDFFVYHAKQHNDQEALNYINMNYKDVLDQTSDETLDALQKSLIYVDDINTLRSAESLSDLKISDVSMLEVCYKVVENTPMASLTPATPASSLPESTAPSGSPSTTPVATVNVVTGTEDIPNNQVESLSKNMALTDVTSIGIFTDEIQQKYNIRLGQEKVVYELKDYETELEIFIKENVTAYKDALTALDTAQTAYDTAAANKAEEEKKATEAPLPAPASAPSVTLSSAPTLTTLTTPLAPAQVSGVPMHRLYNPYNGEHLYTKSLSENDWLVSIGWIAEGIGWTAPSSSNTPVYRLYNPNNGDHHYTVSLPEKDWLVTLGWVYEAIGWYSDDAKQVPIYRQFNPNASVGTHNYTKNKAEDDWLATIGWVQEGIGWYGMKTTAYMQGIDISEHNGDIDLTQYVNGFVIIRAAWGTNIDCKFLRNVQECERLGIPYGVYVYSYAENDSEAAAEAQNMLALLKQCHPTVGVWFDMEDADGFKAKHNVTDPALISSMCRSFCSTIKSNGYHVGVYASLTWFQNIISGVDEYDKWLAFWHYNDGTFTDASSFGTSLHQFTSNPIDRDIMYVDISYFDK